MFDILDAFESHTPTKSKILELVIELKDIPAVCDFNIFDKLLVIQLIR
jgi:hypothetical protein